MYLYWRVQQDLDCLNEVIRFHDPNLIRCYHEWLRRNLYGILLAEGEDNNTLLLSGLN